MKSFSNRLLRSTVLLGAFASLVSLTACRSAADKTASESSSQSSTSVGKASAKNPKKILVVTTTTGFRHSSIETAEKVLKDLAAQSGAFTVEFASGGKLPPGPKKPAEPKNTGDEAKFKADQDKYQADLAKFKTEETRHKELEATERTKIKTVLAEKMSKAALAKYDGIIFANTTGDLPLPDKQGFLDWIKSGKAFAGMHSATDTFRGHQPLDPYVEMIGGEFKSHGAQAEVECIVEDPNHPACRHLGATWGLKDEIYLMNGFDRGSVHSLLSLDKEPNQKTPGDFPIAWSKQYGQGRVFYTSLGHREDVWESPVYQKHILGGLKWALGLESGDSKPQRKSGSVPAGKSASGQKSSAVPAQAANTQDKSGFRPLFNGKDLSGWKYRRADGMKSWSVKDGILVNEIQKGEHGTDLVTEEKFWNFTVRFEYKIPQGANSGFYLRGRHEIQIFDDFAKGQPTKNGNGSIYNQTAPAKFASKPAGEWNTMEATIIENKISVTLNGVKIHDNVECNVATGSEIDNKVKEPGPIFLQGDHGSVSFRNMQIKTL